jgi:hypothetical protein
MSAATPYCSARARCYRCYVSRAKGHRRFTREFNVLMKMLENDMKLCGHKLSDLFQTRDFDSKGSIVLTLPDNEEEIRMRDVLPPCIAGGGRPRSGEHPAAGAPLFEDDGMSRGTGSHVLADGLLIAAAEIVHN